MATKPTIANARWADVAGTPSAGTSAPSAGKRDTGWAVEKPTYQNMNYLLRQFYLWCQYISDQIFSGALVADTLQSVGDVYHGSNVRSISPAAWQWFDNDDFGTNGWLYQTVTTGSFVGSRIESQSAGPPAHMPLECLRVDDTITTITTCVQSAGSNVADFQLVAEEQTTGTRTVIASTTSAANTSRQGLTLSPAHKVQTGYYYFLEVSFAAHSGTCAAYGATVTYVHTP